MGCCESKYLASGNQRSQMAELHKKYDLIAPPGSEDFPTSPPCHDPILWGISRAMDEFLCGCLQICTVQCLPCCNQEFEDYTFPPAQASLGSLELSNKEPVQWVRASRIAKNSSGSPTSPVLFKSPFDSEALIRCQLDSNGLAQAIACLDIRIIHNAFVTKLISPNGKYVLRLFDGFKQQWTRVIVDEKIPAHIDTAQSKEIYRPVLLQIPGNEIWPLVLEKGLAKILGGYDKVREADCAVALQALTGSPVYNFRLTHDSPASIYNQFHYQLSAPSSGEKNTISITKQNGLDPNSMYEAMKEMFERRAIIVASCKRPEIATCEHLVLGHDYMVMEIRELSADEFEGQDVRLIKLRNNFGSFTWANTEGRASAYQRHCESVSAQQSSELDQTSFMWITFTEFWQKFDNITVCNVAPRFMEIQIEPTQALSSCVSGCLGFVLCSQGCKTTDARTSHVDTASPYILVKESIV
eukprot:m.341242 g.341242  ORF g.341242 m.341242 type:complete len:469 (+) comp19953_c0_seq1:304-1710(+)